MFLYGIRRGIRNIIRWTPVIWADEDWDWEYLAHIMEWKLRKMSCNFKEYGITVGSDKNAQEMLTCAELIERLRKDDFTGVKATEHLGRMEEWQKMLGDLIGKKLRSWWW